jgi:hypothetical protein
MTDDGPVLEPIARRGPPVVWVGGLAVVLVAVMAIAIGGRLEPGPSAAPTDDGDVALASAPTPMDPLATTAPATILRSSPAPVWYRPSPWPMGEDGLAGGTFYSSPRPSAAPGDVSPPR